MGLSQGEEKLQRTGGRGLIHLKAINVCQLPLTQLDPYPPTEDGRQEGVLFSGVGWNTVKSLSTLSLLRQALYGELGSSYGCGLELLETVIIQDFIGQTEP